MALVCLWDLDLITKGLSPLPCPPGYDTELSWKNELIQMDDQDQEIICRTQLALLRNRAMSSELTLEEARKLELYSKVLGSIKPKQEDDEKEVKALDSKDLMLLVSNGKAD